MTARHAKPVIAAFLFSLSIFSAVTANGADASEGKGHVDIKAFDCVTEPRAASSTPLPLPGSLPLVDYEIALYSWIMDRKYVNLGWCHDKEVRDTGPFVDGQYHGTHPAVLIYYSPEMMKWLIDRENGVAGEIPDGAMIIKEMYGAPAQIYRDIRRIKGDKKYEAIRLQQLSDWTVMVKDSKASGDGWFWGSVSAPTLKDGKLQSKKEALKAQLDTRANNDKPGSYVATNGVRLSGFGMPCLRCHASAANELTFASLRNIQGFNADGDPLRFLDDGTWRTAGHFGAYPLSLLLKDPELKAVFDIPPQQLPWATQQSVKGAVVDASFDEHDRGPETDVTAGGPQTAAKKAANENSYVNQAFLKAFPQIPPLKMSEVKKFPRQWLDHAVQKSGTPREYITSDNCLGCHGGLSGDTFGNVMFITTGANYGDGYDVSQYGEWRWSPMGLAGRDPIFHAQLESEMAILDENAKHPEKSGLKGPLKETRQAVTNTCLSCHGAMGQRQLQIDAHHADRNLDKNFKVDYFYYSEQLSASEKQSAQEKKYHEYGALAREGISCLVCHRIQQPDAKAVSNWHPPKGWVNPKMSDKELAYLLFHNTTGNFDTAKSDTVYGPLEVAQKPMEHALNLTPTESGFIKKSELCGTCHTINLPNIGSTDTNLPVLQAAETNPAFAVYPHSIEQATFLEWQNSAFARGDTARSCQDCHMPSGFDNDGDITIKNLVSKIAAIEDNTYPDADNGLPADELEVPVRKDYKRHTHVGLNAFLLTMFKQFEPILGVAPKSYMTGASVPGVDLALESMKIQARNSTVAMSVDAAAFKGGTLVVDVTARNKAGHRFPSGVAFRRGFIELLVKDGDNVIWSSGRTNDAGVIVDNAGNPLATELLPDGDCGYPRNVPAGCYQAHHQVITSDKQVQIYEELNRNKEGEFTTSFVHRVHIVKDNRLLPDGWRESSFFKPQGEVMRQFMESTDPHFVGDDPDYKDRGPGFTGKDSVQYRIDLPAQYRGKPLKVEATMYYQAIPPYWLKQRFDLAPRGEATRRLHYLASRLNLDGTVLKQWKFKISSTAAAVQR